MNNYGPNVTKLILRASARFAIPPGGGFADGVKFITDPEYRKKVIGESEAFITKGISEIKAAPDNPYGNDDETIAKALLELIETKSAENKRNRLKAMGIDIDSIGLSS